jgi:predicted DNA-binding protein (MmcQ/YjbR family)
MSSPTLRDNCITMKIELIQSICNTLPAVTEDIKWENDLCFSVGDKMFCAVSLESPIKVSFKVPDEDFGALTEREGFMPAPYLARAKWVTATETAKVSEREWKALIFQSYDLVRSKLPRKVRKKLGID